MARRFRHFWFLALGLIAVAPLSATAHALPQMVAAGCTLADAPDPETFCKISDTAQGGVTLVVESNDLSELVDNSLVVATLGVGGPSIVRSVTEAIAAYGSDVGVTGSISKPAHSK